MHLYEHLHAGSHSHLLSIKAPRSRKAGMHLFIIKMHEASLCIFDSQQSRNKFKLVRLFKV